METVRRGEDNRARGGRRKKGEGRVRGPENSHSMVLY